jgi:hypothetical protein
MTDEEIRLSEARDRTLHLKRWGPCLSETRMGYSAGTLQFRRQCLGLFSARSRPGPGHPPAPATRIKGRNQDWPQLYNVDVIAMPDKWKYPWYAAGDLASHRVSLALIDPDLAKGERDKTLALLGRRSSSAGILKIKNAVAGAYAPATNANSSSRQQTSQRSSKCAAAA